MPDDDHEDLADALAHLTHTEFSDLMRHARDADNHPTTPHPHGPAARVEDGLWMYVPEDYGRCVPVPAVPADPMDAAIHRKTLRETDRTGWTDEQWIDDARTLMNHPDGAITPSLVNGHVLAMLREIDRLDTKFAS